MSDPLSKGYVSEVRLRAENRKLKELVKEIAFEAPTEPGSDDISENPNDAFMQGFATAYYNLGVKARMVLREIDK